MAQPQQQQPPAIPNPFGGKTQSPAAASSPFVQAQKAPANQQQSTQSAAGASKIVDAKDRYKEGKPEDYEGEQGRILEEIYRRVGRLGKFEDDEDIPLVPPKCEWIVEVVP